MTRKVKSGEKSQLVRNRARVVVRAFTWVHRNGQLRESGDPDLRCGCCMGVWSWTPADADHAVLGSHATKPSFRPQPSHQR